MRELLREIGMITRCFESISNIEFKEYGLAKGQYQYLVRICEEPGIIQERAAELIKVDRTTAARAIRKLVDKGFVEKRSDTRNKKNLLLYPTKKGKEIYGLLQAEEDYSNAVALAGLTEEEQTTATRILRRIRENIQDDWETVKKGGKRNYLIRLG